LKTKIKELKEWERRIIEDGDRRSAIADKI
jgi:hypothetical protein